jgi:hypothetical protein
VTGSTGIARPTIVICVALLIGGCGGGPDAGNASPNASPTDSPTSDGPSVPPSPIVRPLRDEGGTAILDPGTYILDDFPIDLAFDIPDGDPPGWHVGMSKPEVAIVLWYTPPEITYAFAIWNADNVYVDPCNPAAGRLEPPIGPSVDDFVAALSNLTEFHVTVPVNVTVGAFRGKEIELTALDSGGNCPEIVAFSAGDNNADLAPGERRRLQVLNVDGVRIVMETREPAERDAAAEAELHQILDSVRIEPVS